MTSITENTSVTQFLLFKASQAKNKRQSQLVTMSRVQAWVYSLVRLVLTLSGFGFLTWGMFTWNIVAGLITAGLSCFVLSWLAKPESQSGNGPSTAGHTDRHGYTTYD